MDLEYWTEDLDFNDEELKEILAWLEKHLYRIKEI